MTSKILGTLYVKFDQIRLDFQTDDDWLLIPWLQKLPFGALTPLTSQFRLDTFDLQKGSFDLHLSLST